MKLKLKNYFQIGIGVGLLIALIGGVVWVQGGYSLPEISPKRPIVEQAEDDSNMDEIPMDSSESQKEILNKDTMAAPEKKIEAVDLIKASEFFAQALRQLTSCLSVNTGNFLHWAPWQGLESCLIHATFKFSKLASAGLSSQG